MVHTIQNLKTSNLNQDFEFQQLLGYLKHMINIIMQIRYTGCYNPPPKNKISSLDLKGEKFLKGQRTIARSLTTVTQNPDGENGGNTRFPMLLLLLYRCSIGS
jgi:hypothetical protein